MKPLKFVGRDHSVPLPSNFPITRQKPYLCSAHGLLKAKPGGGDGEGERRWQPRKTTFVLVNCLQTPSAQMRFTIAISFVPTSDNCLHAVSEEFYFV